MVTAHAIFVFPRVHVGMNEMESISFKSDLSYKCRQADFCGAWRIEVLLVLLTAIQVSRENYF